MLGLKKHTNKKIVFVARDSYYNEVLLKPEPSSHFLPEWWKKMDQYEVIGENNNKKLITRFGNTNASPRKCVPMFDAFNSGYIIPLWSDVQVNSTSDNVLINWRVKEPVFTTHGDMAKLIGTPPGYKKQVFKYGSGYHIYLPKGYSMLVLPPLGYRGLPFQAIPAVIDADKSTLGLEFPVWVKEGMDEEIVEKGTPIVQIIPFKRESWRSEFNFYESGISKAIEDRSFGSTLENHYMRKVRQHKSYK
jgi:antitoxin (DNA-binding transcriptional repressor) of toxin-antitoxin stability system